MTVWLVQYRYEKHRSLERRLAPGIVERWRIAPYGPARISQEAKEDDLVVIWRTIDQGQPEHRPADSGGIVGWGRLRLERRLQSQPEIYFEVTHAFPEAPIPRAEVIAALRSGAGVANNWPGQRALLKLSDVEAEELEHFLPKSNAAETTWHPLASGYPPEWASGWGQDEYGVFVEFTVGKVTLRMRWCPPGQFLMGSPETKYRQYNDEGPQVEIAFDEGFWLFDTPVTNALYDAVIDHTTSVATDADHPVTKVSWYDAQEFLRRLNALIPGLELRLPSEAEWEYACRAGSRTPFEPTVARQFSGRTITPEEVNYDGNFPYDDAPKGGYRKETVAVKAYGFLPNKWGLWQMHGNVLEWCADVWSDSHQGAATDGFARQGSQKDGETSRVLRGGSWVASARNCRSAYRAGYAPNHRVGNVGFRPARGQQGAQASAAEPRPATSCS